MYRKNLRHILQLTAINTLYPTVLSAFSRNIYIDIILAKFKNLPNINECIKDFNK